MTKKLFFILVSALCASSVFALDEAELDSLVTRFQIEEVEVTARSLTKDVIVPQTLKGAELQRLNALSVADALRYFSGVQLKDYGGVGGIKTINVRSMGSQHTAVYYNGVQLGNAQNGQVDLGRFSLDNMDEIQLYNGQKSDIFQSAREFGAAGNVYLTTRKPYFKRNERAHVRAQMRFGSFALANPNVGVDVKLTEALSLTLDAEYVYSNGKYPFRYRRVLPNGETAYDTTAVRQNGDVNAVRTELGLHHYYRTTGFWRVHAYNYWSERGVPGAIVNNVWRNGERLWDRNSFVQATWQDEWFNRWSTRLLAKYANDYTHYRNYDERLLPSDNEYLQQEAYVSLANKVRLFNWWDLSLAYDYQYNALNRENLLINEGKEFFDRHSYWLSAATAFNVKEYLRLQASVLMTAVTQRPTSASEHSDKSQRPKVTPGLFASFKPYPKIDLSLNAFYKQSYRYPTFNDLYYTDLGNANLRPELARQHSVELAYKISNVQSPLSNDFGYEIAASASYYYNRVTDKIIAYPKGQQFRWTMLNLGTVKINGVDAKADMSFYLPLRFVLRTRLNYTYQTAVDVTNPNDTYYGHQIPYIPWHSGSVVVNLDWESRRGDHYGLNYSFIYVGERYCQQENTVYNYVQPWYTHDLSLYGEWGIRRWWLKAYIEINNLLGQDYEVIQNYPMPKQNIRCTLAFRY
ncbi:MAG: TonB-dependent receptor plug domain-containing protein [Paludibacteraceae bacterium]|nr:TonB-dependent receptor plug domain-containing protein [Paludibacteraceae bacterium]MBQ6983841.1 TonB-dependent receptor plug domain-containing protein [Paludibacteraceae bacterium]